MPARRATTARSDVKVTVREVAAHAGVSLMTVSRAVQKPDQVSADTLARVREAMAELGYVPNLAAASLRSAQSKLVAAIVPALTSTHLFSATITALTEALAVQGYQLLVGQSHYRPEREVSLVHAILGRRPDAIFVIGAVQDRQERALLANAGIPVVEAGDLVRQHIDMAVGISHEKMGAGVCRFLAEQGRKRLAIFAGDDARAQRRVRAFEAEAARLGLPAVRSFSAAAPTGFAAGRRLLGELLAAGPRVDAIHCGTDMMAAGVLTECRERGIAVPKDIAVIGMGDLDITEALSPTLTSVRVDGARIGAIGAEMLLARLAGDEPASRRVDVGFEIVRRQSA